MSSFDFLKGWLNEAPEGTPDIPGQNPAPGDSQEGNLNPVDAAAIAGSQNEQKKEDENSGPRQAPCLPKLPKPKVPGSLTMLLLFILFILFAIMPTKSGKTRLMLLWGIMTDGAAMRGQQGAAKQDYDNGGDYQSIYEMHDLFQYKDPAGNPTGYTGMF